MNIAQNRTSLTGTSAESGADRAFEVLADGERRAVIRELSEEGSIAVTDLANRIAHRHDSASRAKVALVHRHLPKLRETGVVRWDRDASEVTMDDADDVLAVLGAVSDRVN